MAFKWKNRSEFTKRCGMRAYQSYTDTRAWIESLDDPSELCDKPLTPSIDLNGIIDTLIHKYSSNAGEISLRTIKQVKRDILVEMYEMARMHKDKDAMDWVVRSA